MTLKPRKIIAATLLSALFTLAATPTFAGARQYGPQYTTLPLSRAGAVNGRQVFGADWFAETVAGQGLPSSPNITFTLRWIGQGSDEASGEIDPWYLRPMDDVILSAVDPALWRHLPSGDHKNPGRWYASHEERQLFVGFDMTARNGSLVAGLNMPPFIFGVGFGMRF